jgi:16S rRNA (guanine527-N7)-methyltransferase
MVRARQKASSAPRLDADRLRALELVPVAPEVVERLDRFVALLLQWQTKINLIAASSVAKLWTRHVADSLQLVLIAPAAKVWVDLGSGGGFPGLVIACALAGRAGAHVHLVESNARKAAFLREAARACGAPVTVHGMRAEEFLQRFEGRADAVTARALASLAELLALSAPLLKTGAVGIFPKGQDVAAELTEAAKYWSIQSTLVPSKTSVAARIVVIHSAERRNNQ